MRNLFLSLSFALSSMIAFSKTAQVELLYYNSFGEYLTEDSSFFELDLDQVNISDLKKLIKKRDCSCSICSCHPNTVDSDLVLLGSGKEITVDSIFGILNKSDDERPLCSLFLDHEKSLQVIFVNRELSHYVREKKDLHWSCPWRFLSEVGKRNLQEF